MTPVGEDVDRGWQFDSGGTLHLAGRGGNVITRETYGDFELWFEFRISERGNSGIKYRVRSYGQQLLGFEYQILDDAAYPELARDQLTGSLYDVFPPMTEPTRLNPAGQFNTGKVLVCNDHVRHWINGQLIINELIRTSRWLDHIRRSKFSEREHFGRNRSGHIMLTDHASEVWYRNVFIRRLSSALPGGDGLTTKS